MERANEKERDRGVCSTHLIYDVFVTDQQSRQKTVQRVTVCQSRENMVEYVCALQWCLVTARTVRRRDQLKR